MFLCKTPFNVLYFLCFFVCNSFNLHCGQSLNQVCDAFLCHFNYIKCLKNQELFQAQEKCREIVNETLCQLLLYKSLDLVMYLLYNIIYYA